MTKHPINGEIGWGNSSTESNRLDKLRRATTSSSRLSLRFSTLLPHTSRSLNASTPSKTLALITLTLMGLIMFVSGCGEDEPETLIQDQTPIEPQLVVFTSDAEILENAHIKGDASQFQRVSDDISVKWDWGDGQQTPYSHNLVAEHTYRTEGEYLITLTIRDNASTSVIATQQKAITVAIKTEIVSETDGATMRLIPAGEFQMGNAFFDEDLFKRERILNEGFPHEAPVHTVVVDAFYMDVTEVTNAMYQQFMEKTGHRDPRYGLHKPSYPVFGVSWHDAMAYAQWAGKRLPTEAEWEYAARGGLVGARYPWGDKITHNEANYAGTADRDQWGTTAPVGRFPPNGYGLYDMVGNVWEWCLDAYDAKFYANSPRINPISGGPIEQIVENFRKDVTPRVSRGGSWHVGESFLRVSTRTLRNTATLMWIDRGFRCVKPLGPELQK